MQGIFATDIYVDHRKENIMQNYLSEIQAALDAGLYTLAITGALSLPDICASLESAAPNDRSNVGKKYKNWYRKYAEKNCSLTPEACYNYRCSMVHQHGSKNKFKFVMPNDPQHPITFNKVAFFLPSPYGPKFINCGVKLAVTDPITGKTNSDEALLIEIDSFVNGMIKSVNDWLNIIKGDKNYEKNKNDLIQPRPASTIKILKGDIVIY